MMLATTPIASMEAIVPRSIYRPTKGALIVHGVAPTSVIVLMINRLEYTCKRMVFTISTTAISNNTPATNNNTIAV